MSEGMRGLLLGLSLLAVSLAAGSASATTGGCYSPFTAAAIFSSEGSGYFNEVELSDDPGHLKQQCREFLKGCKKIVKQSTNCLESAFSSVEDGNLEECKDIEDSEDRKLCKEDVKGGTDELFDILDENKGAAYEVCQECYEDCLEGIIGECARF